MSAAFFRSSDCDNDLVSAIFFVLGVTPTLGIATFFALARFLNLWSSFLATFSLLSSASFS